MHKQDVTYPWDDSRIILVCGTGGVGKTTLSASIALNYALKGYKSAVLTIDPAKRLASAMGIDELSGKPQEIKGTKSKGSLYAMMLNTKTMFDELIERYSPDEEARDRILDHPLYKHLSTMIAGSQEYMAMENLYKIASEYDFEKIVVDTPPSKHALDFLDAPEKMVGALTNHFLKMLIKPYQWAGRHSSKLMGVFGKLTGAQFLQEISDFLASTVNLLDGFKERAEEVTELIHSNKTNIVIVATPSISSVTDASDFIRSIENRDLNVSSCIINKQTKRLSQDNAEIKKTLSWLKKQRSASMKKTYKKMAFIEDSYNQDLKLISNLKNRNPNTDIFSIPNSLDQIHSIDGLKRLYKSIETTN